MSEITKVIDELVQNPVGYTIEHTETGDPTENVNININPGTVFQSGTNINETLLNTIQKQAFYSVDGIKIVEGPSDIYSVTLTGLDSFGVYDGLKLYIKASESNTQVSFIRLLAVDYPIVISTDIERNLSKGDIMEGGYYFLELDLAGGKFYLQSDESLKYEDIDSLITFESGFGGSAQKQGNIIVIDWFIDSGKTVGTDALIATLDSSLTVLKEARSGIFIGGSNRRVLMRTNNTLIFNESSFTNSSVLSQWDQIVCFVSQ